MIIALVIVIIALMVAAVVVEIMRGRRNVTIDLPQIWQAFESVQKSHQSLERSVKDDLAKSREDAAAVAKRSHEDLSRSLKEVGDTLQQSFDRTRETVDQKLQRLQDDSSKKLDQVREDAAATAKNQREEIAKSLKGFQDSLGKAVGEVGQLQKSQHEAFAARLEKLAAATDQKVDGLKTSVEAKLKGVQDDHAKQLGQLRAALEERMQGAEKRLGDSLQQVSDRLDQVDQRLGEPKP